jgi:diadenylate cyclase
MEGKQHEAVLSALVAIAPGTPLREALEYIISARTGALIVIGDVEGVEKICDGGFVVDAEFTPERLFELAKMDGAISLDSDATRIRKANVHLQPDPTLPTSETGMRHRTAERVSRQTDALVISVSQRRDVVSLYRRGERLTLGAIEVLLAKANQALQTLERYRLRLDEVSSQLTTLEYEDVVTLGDVAVVVQRAEMLQRVSREVGRYITELGTEGRLIRMQADELMVGIDDDYLMLIRDYMRDGGPRKATTVRTRLAALTLDQLFDAGLIAQALGYTASSDVDELHVQAYGFRVLHQVPALPSAVVNRVVERFDGLPHLLSATVEALDEVDGVGIRRARAIIEGLSRIGEQAVP